MLNEKGKKMGDTYGINLDSTIDGKYWLLSWQADKIGVISRYPDEQPLSAYKRIVRILLEKIGALKTGAQGLQVDLDVCFKSFDDKMQAALWELVKKE